MKTHTLIILVLFFTFQSCGHRPASERPEEFITLEKSVIDSNHFAASIYSKTTTDSTSLYADTITGVLTSGDDLETEWFDDSVKCIVPTYIPQARYKTPSDLTVILTHRQ